MHGMKFGHQPKLTLQQGSADSLECERLRYPATCFVRHAREFNQRLEYMHMNPVKKGLVKRPEHWRWSSYNNFALDKATVVVCPIQIDYVRLPLGYRA